MSAALGWLLGVSPRNIDLIFTTSVVTTIAVLSLTALGFPKSQPRKIISSPRDTQLTKLSKEQKDALPYPPDAFPGGRDIVSPYGTMRVYEWGPETGRKVLLIHGISTPCVALGGIALGLVEKGCRVMLFDLWGRGYSDMTDLPLDSRLYTTQILLAITSSQLPWIPGGFSLFGYSLGGGIAVDFATYFPDMVNSLILLAPAGLLRVSPVSWAIRVIFNGIMPDSILEWWTKRRLGGGGKNKPMVKTKTGDQDNPTTREELNGNRDPVFDAAPITLHKPKSGITVSAVLQWQIDNHAGFIKSFISSVRHSSIHGKQDTWKKLGERNDRVLIIGGTTDAAIITKELHKDADAAIGLENIEWREIDAGHEFPMTETNKVLDIVSEVWNL